MTEPRCPRCGEPATYQTPDGTFWDSSAHYWREPRKSAEDDAEGEEAEES